MSQVQSEGVRIRSQALGASNESWWVSYDSRVESGVEAVHTGPDTCLIGKESEMYSTWKEKDRS